MIIIENNIKWSNCYLEADQYGIILDTNFEIKPTEFLNYAKHNLSSSSTKRDCINSVINSKLAIDSQIDSIIINLGYDFKKFSSEQIDNILSNSFNSFEGENKKLTFISEMGISPKFLISKYRNIRNALEHEYKLPTIQQTFEFVEIAELFINATTQKLGLDFMSSFTINNSMNQEYYQMYFDLDDISNGKITIRSNIGEKRSTKILTTIDNAYLDLISSVIKREYSRIPKILGYEIEEKYIKVELYL